MFVRIAASKFNEEEYQKKIEETKKNIYLRRNKNRTAIKKIAAIQRQLDDLDVANRSLPVYYYLILCNICYAIVQNDVFNHFILVCIVIAGALVGIATYYGEEDDTSTMDMIDTVIFWVFWVELLVKFMSEGVGWWNFFIGPEWRWNNFDFLVVLASTVLNNGNVTLLRLVRLLRLAKVFRKIPQLQMIIMGLVGGLKSIFYIVILMMLTYYLYAVVGIIYLAPNDPWHFGSVEFSMLTLYRIATLDNWGDAFFVSYLGCELVPSEYYASTQHEADSYHTWSDDVDDGWSTTRTRVGGLFYCDSERETERAPGWLVVSYYVSFIMLASFCMLSLFVGAVSMSMAESMEKMQEEKAKKRHAKNRAMIDGKIVELTNFDNMTRENKRKVELVEQAFTGQNLHLIHIKVKIDWGNPLTVYKYVSDMCDVLVESAFFNNFITFAIMIAGILVGLETYEEFATRPGISEWMYVLDLCVFWVFIFEMAVKVIAEEFQPMNYFSSSWNCFDAFVVFGSVITSIDFIPGMSGSKSLVMMLRLLKLMRVLKLMRALKQLQVIVEALMKGMSSIGFVGLILIIFFYFFGVLGMMFFKDNDPWHFNSLHMTMISLFQCATLDDWTPILYINMFGCHLYGYDDDWGCDPELAMGQPWLATIYFVFFTLVGGLVLLTLFIGVVSMGMDEAEKEQKEESKVNTRVEKIALVEGLGDDEVALYREVFRVIDFTQSSKIGKDELNFGMKVANMKLDEEEFSSLFAKVDKDKSAAIDFAEFLEFMFDLKDQLNSWPIERRQSVGNTSKKRKKKDGFNFLADKGKAKVVPMYGDESGSDMESGTGSRAGSPMPIKHAWSNEKNAEDNHDVYIMRTGGGSYDKQHHGRAGDGDVIHHGNQRYGSNDSAEKEKTSAKGGSGSERRRRMQKDTSDSGISMLQMESLDDEDHHQGQSRGRRRSVDDKLVNDKHQEELRTQKQQLSELQEQIKMLHAHIASLTPAANPNPAAAPGFGFGAVPGFGSPGANMVPSQVIAQQAFVAQQQQMAFQQILMQQHIMAQQQQQQGQGPSSDDTQAMQGMYSPGMMPGLGLASTAPAAMIMPNPQMFSSMTLPYGSPGGTSFGQTYAGVALDGRSPGEMGDRVAPMTPQSGNAKFPKKTPSSRDSSSSPSKKAVKSLVCSI